MNLLPHAHDYDMKFEKGLQWRFECRCGSVVHNQQAALDNMHWSKMNQRVGLVLWGIVIAAVGVFIVGGADMYIKSNGNGSRASIGQQASH